MDWYHNPSSLLTSLELPKLMAVLANVDRLVKSGDLDGYFKAETNNIYHLTLVVENRIHLEIYEHIPELVNNVSVQLQTNPSIFDRIKSELTEKVLAYLLVKFSKYASKNSCCLCRKKLDDSKPTLEYDGNVCHRKCLATFIGKKKLCPL